MSAMEKNAGFATVELIVTLITIGITFIAFTTTFVTIQNINKKSNDIQNANDVAFEKLQTYENKSFNNLAATTPTGSLQEVEDFSSSIPTTVHGPRVGKVYINTVSPTLKQVVINVEFGSDPTKQTIQYATFIQKHGLGR